jgi:hypothetical protein
MEKGGKTKVVLDQVQTTGHTPSTCFTFWKAFGKESWKKYLLGCPEKMESMARQCGYVI